MSYRVSFFKDRQKFSAAHFTLFDDGEVERLHGHNYTVNVVFEGSQLDRGLLFPFHQVKPVIKHLCDTWDEYVLIPNASDWVDVDEHESQVEVRLKTPKVRKLYSFPVEDVRILPCDNVSCENLTRLFLDRLIVNLDQEDIRIDGIEVSISESAGQTVTLGRKL